MTTYRVYVELKDGTTREVRLDGKTELNIAQADWLYKEYKHGRFKGYRKEVIPHPMSMQECAWNEAGHLLGVMEHGGNNAGSEVSKIIKENGGTGPEPWCGDFVAHCYRTGGSHAVTRQWASVSNLGFLGGMRKLGVMDMQLGDIICYKFDHTGLFGFYCDAEGNPIDKNKATHVRTREGNTGASGAVSDSSTGGDGVYEKLRELNLVSRGVKVLR